MCTKSNEKKVIQKFKFIMTSGMDTNLLRNVKADFWKDQKC